MSQIHTLYLMVAVIAAWLAFLTVKIVRLHGKIWRCPAVERYLRCSVTVGEVAVEPGIEWRDGDDEERQLHDLTVIAEYAASLARTMTAMRVAVHVEPMVQLRWPDRAWFIEIHDENGRWSQTYQPMGVPRWSAVPALPLQIAQYLRGLVVKPRKYSGMTHADSAHHAGSSHQLRADVGPPMDGSHVVRDQGVGG